MFEKKLEAIIQSYMQQDFFPGFVGHISLAGETIYHQALGLADTTVNQRMEKDSLFDIASITKMVISTLALRLMTEKKLALDHYITKYLPINKDKEQLSAILSTITIEQLLTHSSGIPDWYPFYAKKEEGDFYHILQEALSDYDLTKKTVYSDINLMLLGEIIQHRLELPLEEAVKNEIADPLELHSLTYHPKSKKKVVATEFGNRIELSMCNEIGLEFGGWRSQETPIRGEVNDGNAYYFFQGIAGHAGLFSTSEDLIKLGKVYLQGGEWKGKRFIDDKLVNKSMQQLKGTRGLGWEVSDLFPQGVGHTGFTGTSLYLVPGKRLVAVLLTNRLHMPKPINIHPFRKEVHQEILKTVIF